MDKSIPLWDVKARIAGEPLAQVLGGARTKRIPAYVSGLPRATLAERRNNRPAWAIP